MKAEEIVKAARDAGFSSSEMHQRLTEFKRLIDSAIAAERDACAKVCEAVDLHNGDHLKNSDPRVTCAAAIRAREHHMIKLNTDKSAAVNQQLVWLSIGDHPPPVGAKLLLINHANGVAVLGTYQAKYQWTHWQGLPKFAEEQK